MNFSFETPYTSLLVASATQAPTSAAEVHKQSYDSPAYIAFVVFAFICALIATHLRKKKK